MRVRFCGMLKGRTQNLSPDDFPKITLTTLTALTINGLEGAPTPGPSGWHPDEGLRARSGLFIVAFPLPACDARKCLQEGSAGFIERAGPVARRAIPVSDAVP